MNTASGKYVALHRISRSARGFAGLLGIWGLCACSVLNPTPAKPPEFHVLHSALLPTARPVPGAVPASRLTLVISPPQAAPGFDSQRIVYLRHDHQLEYFARHEWVDRPAHMLGPLLVAAVQQTGVFAAVVLVSGAAVAFGVAAGGAAGDLFVPLLQLTASAAEQVPPFHVTSDPADFVRLFAVAGAFLVAGLAVLTAIAFRIRIAQAIKLGEE
jgi:hypothetical protein